MRSPWRAPAWFQTPAGRILFLHQLDGLGARHLAVPTYPGGFAVSLVLQPTGVPERHIVIAFSRGRPEMPRVTVDGPQESPHRYPDGTLCMWHPADLRDRRWTRRDGAATLVADIAAHLVREQWYRRTGEWAGEEAQHALPHPLAGADREAAA